MKNPFTHFLTNFQLTLAYCLARGLPHPFLWSHSPCSEGREEDLLQYSSSLVSPVFLLPVAAGPDPPVNLLPVHTGLGGLLK